ncbi:DUF456 domain-containing protein [Streptomyces sp. NPDC006971]|uniref:DUF456 domain-containing protein n=1 Tax=Streptomyces sp. NPDC006971 TaxID=3154784 RepID=UPI0033F25AF9
MGVWQLVAVGLVMFLGLIGVLVPGVPGQAIVWAAVLWWALTDRTTAAWSVLMGATALLLADQALKPLLPPRRPHESGAPHRTLVLGGVGAIVGFFVVPVLGALVGYVGTVYGVERLRLGSRGAGWASVRSVMRATGWSALVELFACLLVTGAWLGVLLWA